MFQLLKDTFLIRANASLNSVTDIKGLNGKNLVIDTDFQKYHHSTQIGEIAYVPLTISKGEYLNDVKLCVGDKVVFHHFVCQPENEVVVDGEKLYKCEYYFMWAKINLNQTFQPLEDFIFVEPILEPESAMRTAGGLMLKLDRGFIPNTGIVFAASNAAKEKGLRMGDRVFFTNDADYDIKITGGNYYRMRLRNIIGIERNGKLECLSNKVLIKELNEDGFNGLYRLKGKERKGVVVSIGAEIKGVGVGDVVSYFYGLSSALNFNGEEYSFLSAEQISYKILEQ